MGVFCQELMACAARVEIGPARQSFWALHLRSEGAPDGAGSTRERTRTVRRRGAVELASGTLRVLDAGVQLELRLEEEAGVEARCPHGRGEVWTRKQAGIPASGTLVLDGGPPIQITARAVIDDTAGYHARRTEWWWSAGVGTDPHGVELAWNLVEGVNDPPSGSERAVWVAGEPHECPLVTFGGDLDRIDCEDGASLHFAAEAERARRENLIVIRSDYRAPFGAFTGSLPGPIGTDGEPIPLAGGWGVMEHHTAVW